MSDLSKYCVHLLGKEGLGQVRGCFSISNYVVYRAVMAVGVCILYISGDFPILCFGLLAISVCLTYCIPSKSQTIMVTCSYSSVCLNHLLWDTTLHLHITDQ